LEKLSEEAGVPLSKFVIEVFEVPLLKNQETSNPAVNWSRK
jgi:hypothetical protein